jgi:hypothetical protein
MPHLLQGIGKGRATCYAHSAEEWCDAVIMRCAMRRIRKVSAKCTNTSFFHQYIRA